MNGINVDVWAVKNAARNITNYVTDITTLSGEIKRIEEMVRAAWQGDYVDDYISCLEATRRKVDDMGDVLLKINVNLGNIATSVETAERELKERLEAERYNGGGGGSW